MFKLVHTLNGSGKFPFRRGLGFLDEAVKDDDALAGQGAEKRPAYALQATSPYLEQTATHSAGVGHAEIRAKFPHTVSDAEESGANAGWPRQNLSLDLGREKFKDETHDEK